MQQLTVGRRATRLAVCAAIVGAGLAAQAAHAVVVTTSVTIPVPFNLDGVYLNVVTGATGSAAAAVTGWDINPYFTGSTTTTPGLAFFATATGDLNRGIITTPLSSGSTLLPTATFATGAQPVAALSAGTYNFGFRFTNESTGAVNVGYVTMQIAPPLAANAVRILGWAYENTGAGLTVSPVPEPSSALMLVGGLLAAAAMRKRLQGRQDA